MELTIAIIISILSAVISVSNFVLNRKDKAVQDTKENNYELIKWQLESLKDEYKEMASDIKEIMKKLDTYKDTFRGIVKTEMEEHVKLYHSKER